MSLPDYIIAGVQRSGTTSLHNWLMAHPDVWDSGEPYREMHFFDYPVHWSGGMQWYNEMFAKATGVIGEKSPTYFDHPMVPARIAATLPDVKIIVCLRNPVDRAWSHYFKARAKGFEKLSLRPAIIGEDARLEYETACLCEKLWRSRYYESDHHVRCYLRRGRYAEHLARWFEYFPREQVMLVKSEEMYQHPARIYADVLDFLGLKKHMLRKWKRYQRGTESKPHGRMQIWLQDYFESHNQALAEMLQDDRWLWR